MLEADRWRLLARSRRRGIALRLVVPGLLAIGMATCAQADDTAASPADPPSAPDRFSAEPSSDAVTSLHDVTVRFETRFMENMIDHHAMAVDMGMACLNKALHPDLVQLCRGIVDTQQREIDTMRAWLRRWYAIEDYVPKRSDAERQRMDALAAQYGTAFETAFLDAMTVHHSEAIADAGACLNLAVHAPLVGLCGNIRDAQIGEVQRMLRWHDEWFSAACRSPPQ